MNTKNLAKQYDCLTPWERLPLIMAAFGRGDETERQRLINSAPSVSYRVPDHFGLTRAFRDLSILHLMELLDLAALYFRALGLSDAMDEEQGQRLLDAALLVGYLFKIKLAAWRAFCAEFHLDPELWWSGLPGFSTIKEAERVSNSSAFTAEAADAYLRRTWGDERKVLTEANVTASLRECLKESADW